MEASPIDVTGKLTPEQVAFWIQAINERGDQIGTISREHTACYFGARCVRKNCFYIHYENTPCRYENRKDCPNQLCEFMHSGEQSISIRYVLMIAFDQSHGYLMPVLTCLEC